MKEAAVRVEERTEDRLGWVEGFATFPSPSLWVN